MNEKRLDIYVKEIMNISRQKAQELIQTGCVLVNNKIDVKPSSKVSDTDSVSIESTEDVLKFVGRGGYKLEKAIKSFKIDVKGICIDIGSSTGGFTDCMLREGADIVYAVDVGRSQLHDKLKNDKRVISMENTDIRNAEIEQGDFIGCDVSFISLKKIFPKVYELMKEDGEGVFLIKPQFEAGRENLSKNGIVKNPKVHKKVIRDIISCANENKLYIKGITFSPIQGGDGNIEYLIYICKKNDNIVKQQDIDNVVDKAFDNF